MVKKTLFALVLMIAALFSGACFNMKIKQDVDFPAGRFAEAWARLAWLEKHNPDRIGGIAEMHVLIYDGPARELLQVALPIWMVRMAEKHERKCSRPRSQAVADRYIDLDWTAVEGISRLGPGLLVQVEDTQENTHVLVWLE